MIGHPPLAMPRGFRGDKRRKMNQTVHRPEQRRGEPLPSSRYGTDLQSCRPGFIRILSQNINGLGFASYNDKLRRLHDTTSKYGIDLIAMSELNINWNKALPYQTLQGRTSGWKENVRVTSAHNTTDPQSPRHQYGGTGLIAMDKLASAYLKPERDFRDLGRWSSMSFRGKGGLLTRVVSCYCPVKPSTFHAGSVYNQHVIALQLVGIHQCPQGIDLNLCVDQWKARGEQLIIAGDFNYHIRVCNEKLAGKGLKEFITDNHGLASAPATHQAGSVPIDGIFVSEHLTSHMRGGYMPFARATLSDHRALWLEMPIEVFLGYNMNDIVHLSARRLKLQDPRVVKKYVDYLHEQFEHHKIYDKLATLVQGINYLLLLEHQEQYESIDKIRIQCMVATEKRCRKLRMGLVPFSAVYKKSRDLIDFWSGMRKKVKGLHCDTRRLLRLMRRLNIDDCHYPLEIIQTEVDKAWTMYKEVCSHPDQYCQEFVDGLAEAQAEQQNISKAKALRNLQHREIQRSSSRTIQYVLRKLHGGGTSLVIVRKRNRKRINISEGNREGTHRGTLEEISPD